MKRLLKKQFIFSLMITALSINLAAESFRVSKVHIASINQDTNFETTVKLGINDGLGIELPADQTFIEGLELKMDIPESVAYWMDSVACSVYANVNPNPKSSQIDYSGTRAYVSTLPGKLSWVLQIPIKKENSIKSNKYTTKVDSVVQPKNNFIFMRLQPVMKGVPEETSNAIIPITIKPILTNKGMLDLSLTSADKNTQNCSVFIDDNIADISSSGKVMLDTGIHNISIISEAYRNEIRTVRIDQAKITKLTVEMKSIEPTLLITAPEGTKILLDDQPCTEIGSEFQISEGDHKIKFSIGDYEIYRTITAIKGKTYKANFSLDLDISEE